MTLLLAIIALTLLDFAGCVALVRYILTTAPYTWSVGTVVGYVSWAVICTCTLIYAVAQRPNDVGNQISGGAKNYNPSLAIIATLLGVIAVEMFVKIGY